MRQNVINFLLANLLGSKFYSKQTPFHTGGERIDRFASPEIVSIPINLIRNNVMDFLLTCFYPNQQQVMFSPYLTKETTFVTFCFQANQFPPENRTALTG